MKKIVHYQIFMMAAIVVIIAIVLIIPCGLWENKTRILCLILGFLITTIVTTLVKISKVDE